MDAKKIFLLDINPENQPFSEFEGRKFWKNVQNTNLYEAILDPNILCPAPLHGQNKTYVVNWSFGYPQSLPLSSCQHGLWIHPNKA